MAGGVRTTVRTNAVRDSVCRVGIEPVRFATLWAAYPDAPPYVDAKTGKPPKGYENQCAIKVSAVLHRAGVMLRSFKGASVDLSGQRAAIRAEDLAAWLAKQPFCGLPSRPENVTGAKWHRQIRRRTGILYFANYWLRPTDRPEHPTGDHIDLWNGSRLTASGIVGSLVTTARYLGLRSFFPQSPVGYSDLGRSKAILFWEIQ